MDVGSSRRGRVGRGVQGSESEVSVELDAADEVHKRAIMADMGLIPAGWWPIPPAPPPPHVLHLCALSGRADRAATCLPGLVCLACGAWLVLQRKGKGVRGSPRMPSCWTAGSCTWWGTAVAQLRVGVRLQVPLPSGL